MNSIVFTIALFLSICLVGKMFDACFGSKERIQALPLIILTSLAWGLYHWMSH